MHPANGQVHTLGPLAIPDGQTLILLRFFELLSWRDRVRPSSSHLPLLVHLQVVPPITGLNGLRPCAHVGILTYAFL